MREYPKIETLFERDADFSVSDRLRMPVLSDISKWIVTEKIDGTNIRVSRRKSEAQIRIGGRTENAQLHADLVKHIYERIQPAAFDLLFSLDAHPDTAITLFGEGYGAGIQKGGDYRQDKAFVLFDVLIECGDGAWWQDESTVTDFANKLGIERVPILGEWSLEEIVQRVRAGLESRLAKSFRLAEGVVGKTREPLFDRRGRRLILKLKTRDYGKPESLSPLPGARAS